MALIGGLKKERTASNEPINRPSGTAATAASENPDDPEGAPADVVVEAEIHHHVPPRHHDLVRSGHEESAECASGVLYQRRKEPPGPKNDDEAAHRQDQTSTPGDGLLRCEVGA